MEAFLDAEAGSVALAPSTSSALSVIAESVSERSAKGRNRIVCSELDFPTLAYQCMVKPDTELVVLPSPDGIGMDLQQYADAVDERTLFLATSHVFFATGFIQDLKGLATIAADVGAYSLIDGYHGPGQISFSLSDCGVDMYTGGPLKWLCGGPGLAYLYVKPEIIRSLEPRITGWFAARDAFSFKIREFDFHDDARRFEMGTPALPTVHTALGGQEILDDVGIETIQTRNRELTDHLIHGCRRAGYDLTIAEEPAHRSAIVMVRHPNPARAVDHLAEAGIIVDHRPGHVRVSPHFYNTEEELDYFLDRLKNYRD
jgi:selenocysteine lyase/cysteine desulfurase